jgi:hypothetical protein
MKRFVSARDVRDFDMTKLSLSEVYNAGPGIVPEREILLRFGALPCSNASLSPASTKYRWTGEGSISEAWKLIAQVAKAYSRIGQNCMYPYLCSAAASSNALLAYPCKYGNKAQRSREDHQLEKQLVIR